MASSASHRTIRNITLLKYSPELNPIEQVWQWIRQHELSNRVFKNYNDIVDCCCEALNWFISDVDRVKKMCFRDWLKVESWKLEVGSWKLINEIGIKRIERCKVARKEILAFARMTIWLTSTVIAANNCMDASGRVTQEQLPRPQPR